MKISVSLCIFISWLKLAICACTDSMTDLFGRCVSYTVKDLLDNCLCVVVFLTFSVLTIWSVLADLPLWYPV